jgi:branched-chain amino acid transport system substrate-binding protein
MAMSTQTKRILAIGLAVVIIVSVGAAGVWFLLVPRLPAYQTPGAPAGVPYDRIIKIGLLDPLTEIQGKSAWEGAYLAVWEINAAGGVSINGTTYYLGLIAEDTKEADAVLDVTKGVAAAQKILTEDQAEFIIGGFRTEALKSYIEVVMDKQKVFIHTGASTDYFQYLVAAAAYSAYNRYKYCFRVMPINSTSLGKETITELAYLRAYLSAIWGQPISKWAILRENLDWTIPMRDALVANLKTYGWAATPTAEIAYPLTAGSTDFASYWQTLNASGAQVVIPIISAQGGIYMMTQYNATQPRCLVLGIDVPSQLDSFWAATNGKCRYEVLMQPLIRTNKTALSIPFWDHYVGNYSGSPLYTGIGSYDAVYLLTWAMKNCSSFISDRIVTALEQVNKANPIVGVSGNLAFQRTHDLEEGSSGGKIWGVTLWVQWHRDGTKVCITSGGLIYPNYVVTGTIEKPPWGINP